MHTKFVSSLLAVFLGAALMLFAVPLQAAVSHPVMPYRVIKKLPVDPATTDRKALVHEVAETIKEHIEDYSHGYFTLMTADDGMDPAPIDIIEFPTISIQGQDEFAAEVEVLTAMDNEFYDRFGNAKAVSGPWSIVVYTSSSQTAQMLNQLGSLLGIDLCPEDPADYVLVSILNPLAVSKISFRELNWLDNLWFNLHCCQVRYNLTMALNRILAGQTGYAWQQNWNQIYNGLLPITRADLDKLTEADITPTVVVPDYDANELADAYTDYVRSLSPMYKSGGELAGLNQMVQVLFSSLFSWMDPEDSFDCDLTAYGGPVLHFENLDDFKAQFPGMVDGMFSPLWENNLTTQGWKYVRRLRVGDARNANLMEMCAKFYAITALGTGLHHTPAMPCMTNIYQDGDDAGLNMFTAKATFTLFFKDATMMMEQMNKPVQAFMFSAFPDLVYNDLAALLNGSLEAEGVDEAYRFPIKRFRPPSNSRAQPPKRLRIRSGHAGKSNGQPQSHPISWDPPGLPHGS
jgi:hypothetical protein